MTKHACTWLVLPGYQGSGAEHWQTLWTPRLAGAQVVQQDWEKPSTEAWAQNLDNAVRQCASSPILVAHSLGCIAVAQWAVLYSVPIRGAFLVAPPDLENKALPTPCLSMAPTPRNHLPFPTMLIASDNDPYSSLPRSQALARDWGSVLVDVGSQGHINVTAGHGEWQVGWDHLRRFSEGLGVSL